MEAGSSKAGGTGTVGNVVRKLGICPTLLDVGMKKCAGTWAGGVSQLAALGLLRPLTKPKNYEKKMSTEIINGVSQSERIKHESQLVLTMGADKLQRTLARAGSNRCYSSE